MENIEIARVLNAYADLVELKVENRFRIRSYRASMSGSLRVEGGISPLGTPTMIGAIALHSAGIPSSVLISGVFKAGTANPITQEPSPMAWAASNKFCAASQQSATTKGPLGLPQMIISVPAL